MSLSSTSLHCCRNLYRYVLLFLCTALDQLLLVQQGSSVQKTKYFFDIWKINLVKPQILFFLFKMCWKKNNLGKASFKKRKEVQPKNIYSSSYAIKQHKELMSIKNTFTTPLNLFIFSRSSVSFLSVDFGYASLWSLSHFQSTSLKSVLYLFHGAFPPSCSCLFSLSSRDLGWSEDRTKLLLCLKIATGLDSNGIWGLSPSELLIWWWIRSVMTETCFSSVAF